MQNLFAAPDGTVKAVGTREQPLELQTALNLLDSGDHLTILPGRYVGAFVVPDTATGAKGAETTIEALDGVVIDGEDRYPVGKLKTARGGIGYGEGYLYLIKASHLRHTGMIEIRNSIGSGLRINATENVHFDGAVVDTVRWQLWRVDTGKDHVVRNITATNGGLFNPKDRPAAESDWCNAAAGKDTINCLYENIVIGMHWGEGFGISGSGNTLRNFEVFNCFSAGIYLNRCGATLVENALIWHDGQSFLRGGSQPNGLIFGNEKAEQQAHRDPTHDVECVNVVTVNMGPGLSFRSQTGEGFTRVWIHDCTFYESRESGKNNTAIYLKPNIAYDNVRIDGNLVVQTVGSVCNVKTPPVDLSGNTIITDASKSPLQRAHLIYTGTLADYIAPGIGAKDWMVDVEPEVDPEPEEEPTDSDTLQRLATVEAGLATLHADYAALASMLAQQEAMQSEWVAFREGLRALVG